MLSTQVTPPPHDAAESDATMFSAQTSVRRPSGGDVANGVLLDRISADENAEVYIRQLIDLVISDFPESVYIKDRQSRFVFCNEAVVRQHGFKTAADIIGKSDFDVHPFDIARPFFDEEQEMMRSGVSIVDRCERNGNQRWFSSTKIPIRDKDGRGDVVGFIGVARNITGQRGAETLLMEQSRVIEMIALNAPLERILDKLIKLAESRLPGLSGSIQIAGGPSPLVPDAGDYGRIRRGPPARRNWAARLATDGDDLLGTLTFSSQTPRVPTALECEVVESASRTARIALERDRALCRIHDLAYTDPLTGLLNRTSLGERLPQAIAAARSTASALQVAFVDLDQFKLINDTLGHSAGDTVLKTIAARMRALAGPSDALFRIGGDEFVIVQVAAPPGSRTMSLLRAIRAALAKPIDIGGHTVCVTGSVGVAAFPQDGESADALMMNADAAMYRAKDLGRNRIQAYRPEMRVAAEERLTLNRDLQKALGHGEFELHYQPQIDLRTGAIFAVEALLRWNHPRLGSVSPAKFIPLAEETGAIVQIGHWVLAQACAQGRLWQEQHPAPIVVCVNVSPRQFHDKNWAALVLKTLKRTGLAGALLEIEITESCLMGDIDGAIASMNRLKANGISIAIDDFGTGYSNLGALKRFPVSRLKIDRSFIGDMLSQESDRAIASAFISLGQKLGLRVIAEGVETADQLEFLCRNNCDEMQGYLFSRPVPAASIGMLLRQPAFRIDAVAGPGPGG